MANRLGDNPLFSQEPEEFNAEAERERLKTLQKSEDLETKILYGQKDLRKDLLKDGQEQHSLLKRKPWKL